MAKKNINARGVIVVFAVIIGIILGATIRLNVGQYIPVTIKSIAEAQEELDILEEEIDQLKLIYNDKSKQLKSFEDQRDPAKGIEKEILDDLEFRKIKSGYSDIEGPGIEIKMYDNQESEIIGYSINDDIIHDVDILNILNDLKVAGAEAISINGERILASSEIKCGGPIIKVNNKSLATPFIINAVGDSRSLMASVVASGTYGDTLKNVYSIGFEPEEKENIVIPAYNKEIDFIYARPKGEVDN